MSKSDKDEQLLPPPEPPANPMMLSEDERKIAKGRIYKMLFKSRKAQLAILPSIILGLPTIAMFIISGHLITDLIKGMADPSLDGMHKIFIYSMVMIGLSAFIGICKYIESYCWMQCGSELAIKIRIELFNKLMQSDVFFFDMNPIGGLLNLLSEDTQLVQESFGPVKGIQIANISTFIGGIIGSFVYSWKIGLIFVASFALIGIVMLLFMPFIGKAMGMKFFFLGREMTMAQEALTSFRTIRSFNREDIECQRFHQMNFLSQKNQRKASILIAIFMIFCMAVIWGTIIGNLYFAATLVNGHKDGIDIGDLLSIFGFCMNGSMAIISLSSTGDNEGKAIESSARIIRIIEYQPEIQFEGGDIIEDFKGEIEFKNVSFKYPARTAYALQNVSFNIKPGQISAFVGHSGSGKSTCIQLIERFYDVTEGEILLDGKNIQTLDPRWIHQKIRIVSQEPILFNTTIRDNILYGNQNCQFDQILQAAEISNARKFIEKFDNGFNTIVGEKGSLLSGGQKQRIAIARAIIHDPVILIADEATSALDTSNEKKVQAALNKVMKNRTSLVVAHRLSTIKNADIIFVFASGKIIESGTHQALIDSKGIYYNLVSKQLINSEDNKLNNENLSSNNNNNNMISIDNDSDASISSENNN